MIVDQRLEYGNKRLVDRQKSYLLYWVDSAPRISSNGALAFAIEQSHALKKPLLVYFGLYEKYPEANLRHFQFLIEGLQEFYRSLKQMNIRMVIAHTSPSEGALALAKEASLIISDKAYLAHQRESHNFVCERCLVPFIEVESNVVVPIRTASNKEEYSAATLRRKIEPMISYFSAPIQVEEYKGEYYEGDLPLEDLYHSDSTTMIASLAIDRSLAPSSLFIGGESEAKRRLNYFIDNHLASYAKNHSDPAKMGSSSLSAYLHFGQISPLEIYQKVSECDCEDRKDFLEQLVVRRELAFNFVYYNWQYDRFDALPDWAKSTLQEHSGDHREYCYTYEQLDKGETHDEYWNAAQKELTQWGTMHNYMRMYWGKKILEWTKEPPQAYQIALQLNNRYQLDGRDPNGFAGVAWCFGKHDRPWARRAIFGSVRYMNDKGLRRKFDMKQYVDRIENRVKL